MVAGASAGVIAGVIAIEARALEHDPHGVKQLAQAALALRAFAQRVFGEGLDDLKAVFARGTRVGVRWHGSSGWHSKGVTAKCTAETCRGLSKTAAALSVPPAGIWWLGSVAARVGRGALLNQVLPDRRRRLQVAIGLGRPGTAVALTQLGAPPHRGSGR